MASVRGPGQGRADESISEPAAGGSAHHAEIDWEAAARSPEFRGLIKKKRAFVIPATAFFLTWYFGFIILAGYAPDFMGETFITDGLTVGYALALSQFVMVWLLGWMYLRAADRDFDPLAERAAEQALRAGEDEPRGHFDRSAPPTTRGSPSDEEVTRS